MTWAAESGGNFESTNQKGLLEERERDEARDLCDKPKEADAFLSRSRSSPRNAQKVAEEYDDFFEFLKCAFWGRKMATYHQPLNLYWGRTKQGNLISMNKKAFKLNFSSKSDSLYVIQPVRKS